MPVLLQYFTSLRYATCVTNLQFIVTSQGTATFDSYTNCKARKAVIVEGNNLLDKGSMVANAQHGGSRNSGLSIIETKGTNHFISLENLMPVGP